MGQAFIDYFRAPAQIASLKAARDYPSLSEQEGYFTFGDAVCFGKRRGGPVVRTPTGPLPTAPLTGHDGQSDGALPFDLSEIVKNLRQERYTRHLDLGGVTSAKTTHKAYYFLRPVLPVSVRRHLQKIHFRGWDRIPFPRWPVDVSVERLMKAAMARLLERGGVESIPFIWFWPDGAPSCALMTHDVEGGPGLAFCHQLMDLDDSFGIKAAFQLVPEMPRRRSHQLGAFVDEIRGRGFEVNLHDLNHDGHLFHDRSQFLGRAARINRYARELACRGFRSGAMYREQEWFDAFEFSFDMSVPNVAHLEPQRGGCCTVMPYFVGKILELPLTTIQDYSLFHILGDYSIDLWKEQIDLIRAENGLITLIAHPDYLRHGRARAVYTDLLIHLCELRARNLVWMALPTAVDEWWRNRHRMSVVPDGRSWRVVGPGSERARVAFAALDGDRVTYTVSGRS
jgi:hypothetical protein